MQKPYVLGLDMGGTNSVLGVVDARGHVLGRTSIKTQAYKDINDYVNALYEEAEKIIEPLGGMEMVRGIGAGVPNGNFYTGYIQEAMNLPWQTVPFAKLVSDRFGLPCRITNDANAAAMGEMTYGAAKGMKNFIMITLGTGVGSGIVIDGNVVYGHDGFAGELGHTTAVRGENARPCNCGKKGCLEAYASATGVARTAKEILTSTTKETLLRKLDVDNITSKDVYDAAEQGDEVAKEIFDFTGTILGQQLADFIAFSAPEAIVLFGGLTKSGDWIKRPIEEAMNQNVLPLWKNKVKVLFSDLKEADAAVLGASALAWSE
ncbi:MAG: ROK family protein [Paludibacteraceae bacterium]|jgi:glucokinase|nr:ROK family protein [Paludibacteraceae bacterium]